MDPKPPLAHCDECPLKDRPFVPGDGPSRTDRVIVGEAPGETEVKKGKPFVGRAGTVLNEELGIDRSSVYITNAVLCHPGRNKKRNKKPSVRAIRACHDRLIREIRQRPLVLAVTMAALHGSASCAVPNCFVRSDSTIFSTLLATACERRFSSPAAILKAARHTHLSGDRTAAPRRRTCANASATASLATSRSPA